MAVSDRVYFSLGKTNANISYHRPCFFSENECAVPGSYSCFGIPDYQVLHQVCECMFFVFGINVYLFSHHLLCIFDLWQHPGNGNDDVFHVDVLVF